MMKLILLASISHSSLQLIFFLSKTFHCIHFPCLARDSFYTSENLFLMPHLLKHQLSPLCTSVFGRLVPIISGQSLLFSAGLAPTISLCLRVDIACCTALDGVHFCPVNRCSRSDLQCHLESYFGTLFRLVRGNSRAPLPQRPMLLRGKPSHLLGYEVIVRSIDSKLQAPQFQFPRQQFLVNILQAVDNLQPQLLHLLFVLEACSVPSAPLTKEMLQGLFGLIFVQAHLMFSCSFPNSRLVALMMTSIVMGKTVQLAMMPTSKCCLLVVKSAIVKHSCRFWKYVLTSVVISPGTWKKLKDSQMS